MPAPLIESHPEIVTEIRRLAKKRKTRSQIISAIKEKFNYDTTFNAVNRWADVDFDHVGSGRPLTADKIQEIQDLMSVENPPSHTEAARILGVGERSIGEHKLDSISYRKAEDWAEQYPDLRDRLLSSDRPTVVTALNTASARQQREVARAVTDAAEISKLEDPDFTPLTDNEAREFAEKKAEHIVKGQKTRALLYRISPGIGPENFVSYPEYRKLQKSGNAPEILGRRYQGDFSPEGMASLRKIVYDKLYPYLKAGGNPATFDQHLGHIIAMKGSHPGTRDHFVSGLTNKFNAEMQDADLNRKANSAVSKELLKGLGYKSILPYGLGTLLGLGTAGFSDEGWTSDQFKKTVKDRSFWGDILLGLHSKKLASDPGRASPWRIGATIAQDTASDIAGLLRIDDPTEDDYVEAQQMGRKPDILTPQIYDDGKPTGIFGHPGIRDEIIRKRKPNIWT